MKATLAATLLLFYAFGPARADEVDDYVQIQMRQLHIPGVSVAVVREGRIVKSQGYGLADVELKVPATEDTVFEIGSLTKQFTAVALLMLVEEGKIGLDDRITKYFTYHGRRVISHSGGTPGFSSVIYRFPDDRWTVILLTNHTDRVIDPLAVDIAGLYVPALARPKNPGAEPDAEISRRLKQALSGLFAGKPDLILFTPAMQIFLGTATGKGLWPWAGSDGEMKSFTFSEQEEAGEHRILRYKAVLGDITRWFSFTVTDDGKIAQINWW